MSRAYRALGRGAVGHDRHRRPTSLTLAYVHQEDDNIAGLWRALLHERDQRRAAAGRRRQRLFRLSQSRRAGHHGRPGDRDASATSSATIVSIRNLTRWQRVEPDSARPARRRAPSASPPPAASRSPANADQRRRRCACRAPRSDRAGPLLYPSRPARHWCATRTNQLLYNQTDLRVDDRDRAAAQHAGGRRVASPGRTITIVTGDAAAQSAAGTRDRAAADQHLAIPNTIYTGPINFTVTGRSRSANHNAAIYAFDTLELGPHLRAQRRRALGKQRGDLPQPSPLDLVRRATPALRPRAAAAAAAATRSCSPIASARCSSRSRTSASTPPTATRRRRPRRRCGSAAARSPRGGAADPCDVAPGNGAQLRDRRQGRRVRPAAAAHRGAVPQRAQQFPRAIERSVAAHRLQVLDGRVAGRRRRARRDRQHHPRVDDLRQLHLSRQRGAAERLGLLPGQSGAHARLRQHATAHPRSAGRRAAAPDAASIRAACSPPTACRSGSSSATA